MLIFNKMRDVKDPSRGTRDSAGIDFYIPEDWAGHSGRVVRPGESYNIPSGIRLVIEQGYAGVFFNKSSIGVSGLMVGACVVDSDYRGEVHLNVHNVSNKEITLLPGQKLTQMLILAVEPVKMYEATDEVFQKFNNTQRGTGGFGSTGAT